MQCMMNCQPQNRKRRNRQLPIVSIDSDTVWIITERIMNVVVRKDCRYRRREFENRVSNINKSDK